MKTIIAGSRDITDFQLIVDCIEFVDRSFPITEVVCGEARGVDRCGKNWARAMEIPVSSFLPDWRLGSKAALDRNQEMAEYGDFLLAVWDGISTGTQHMIRCATNEGLGIMVFRFFDGRLSYELLQ